MGPNPQKRSQSKVADLTVYFETYASRTPLCRCSQNMWLLLIKFKSWSLEGWFVLVFKNIKMLWQNLKLNQGCLNVQSNSSA